MKDYKLFAHMSAFVLLVALLGIVAIVVPSGDSAVERSTTTQLSTVDVATQLQARIAAEQEALAQQNQELTEQISTWIEGEPGDFAVVVEELDGQRYAEYNAKVPFVSASTYKLFYVFAVLREIETTDVTLQSKTTIGRTVIDCIDSLLTYSWDDCGYPFAQLVGQDDIDELLATEGFANTDVTNYDVVGDFTGDKYTTAADEALFMRRLYAGDLLNAEHTELMLNFLKNQQWRERIPAGVPDGIVVADKPGWLYEYENDAAIVYGEYSTYVLVILSNNSSEPRLADLSGLIYDFLN